MGWSGPFQKYRCRPSVKAVGHQSLPTTTLATAKSRRRRRPASSAARRRAAKQPATTSAGNICQQVESCPKIAEVLKMYHEWECKESSVRTISKSKCTAGGFCKWEQYWSGPYQKYRCRPSVKAVGHQS